MFQQRSDAVGANAFNSNVWQGTQFEIAVQDSLLELAVLGSATGLQTTISTGADVLCIDQGVSVVRAANQYALYPDDYVIQDLVGVTQRITEAIRNTTGGSLTAFSSLRMTPL